MTRKRRKKIRCKICQGMWTLFYSVGQCILLLACWFTVVLMSQKPVVLDWTVAGMQSFVSRLLSCWFKRPFFVFLQMIFRLALFKMKGAGLSVSDFKVLFHVMQINLKMSTLCDPINLKKSFIT